jgi:hypothetical protein
MHLFASLLVVLVFLAGLLFLASIVPTRLRVRTVRVIAPLPREPRDRSSTFPLQ